MVEMRVVLDTNVIVAAFRSRRGASNRIVRMTFQRKLFPVCSTALFLEYEAVLSRDTTRRITGHGPTEIKTIMDAFAAIAEPVELSFRMRPMLGDSADEMVLEAAFNAGSVPIVTHNVRDFEPARRLGVEVFRPGELLRRLDDE